MDIVKFGMIGCGMAARFHIMGMRNVPDPKLKFVAAYDVNEKAVTRFSNAHKLTPYTNLDKFLEADFDAVLLMVPHFLHEELAIKVAEAGKHLLCEKPMATTLEECDSMIAATKKTGVKFMIAENHRFLPAHLKIKELIDQDIIGEVFLGRTFEGAYDEPENFHNGDIWHFTYDKGGGGVLADQGPHKFAHMNWLFGEVDFAQCWLAKSYDTPPNKGEDSAIVLLRYKCGAMIVVDVSSTTVHHPTNRLELNGTMGTILEDHDWTPPIKVFSNSKQAEKRGQWYDIPVEHGSFPQYYIISARNEDSYFAECILNGTDPVFTPEQAKEAIAVVLLAYLAAQKGAPTTMDELKQVAKTKGTRTILDPDGLLKVTQQNYANLRWDWIRKEERKRARRAKASKI